MKELVEYIVKAIVDEKDKVEIIEKKDGTLTILTVKVADGEIGKVIGKNGRIATSIRNIVKSLSMKEGNRYIVKIGEDNKE